MLLLVLLTLTALFAALPWGYLLTSLKMDIDIRATGSGNIGATNVARATGWRLGLLTLGLDAAKGAVPVLLMLAIGRPEWAPFAGLAAFIGHCWTPYLDFQGGKGVATATGVALVLATGPTLWAMVVWLVVTLVSRKPSLGALVAAPGLVAFSLIFPQDQSWVLWALAAGIGIRHLPNFRRMLSGQEPKFQAGTTKQNQKAND
jgi:glycerol-3-phosphate acyltransferase PlsY